MEKKVRRCCFWRSGDEHLEQRKMNSDSCIDDASPILCFCRWTFIIEPLGKKAFRWSKEDLAGSNWLGDYPAMADFYISSQSKNTRECFCVGENTLLSPSCSDEGKHSWETCGFQVRKDAEVLFIEPVAKAHGWPWWTTVSPLVRTHPTTLSRDLTQWSCALSFAPACGHIE